ncbi:MAG: hypothetical protein AAFN27_13775 [Pseudomonadota bacterium]
MKTLVNTCAALMAASILAGCETVNTIAPQTVAGFEANGIIGAIDGASGAIIAKCRTLDGDEIRVSVDLAGDVTGQGALIDRVRAARKHACESAGNVQAFVDTTADGTEELVALDDTSVTGIAANTDVRTDTGEETTATE